MHASRTMIVLLTLAAIVAQVNPALAAWLDYDRAAIAGGQVWRIVTCHLTHWTLDHFIWDAGMFVLLCGLLDREYRKSMLACLAAAAICIPLAIGWLMPELSHYRGLSGLDSALFVLLASILLRESLVEKRWSRGALAAIALTAFVAKAGYEYLCAQTVFVDSRAAEMIPIPLAHVVGGLVGFVIAIATNSRFIALKPEWAAALWLRLRGRSSAARGLGTES